MFERAKGIVRKVTLEVIYEVVEEKAHEIKAELRELKDKQEQDFRYLNQRIDEQTGQVRQEIGQVRQEIGQLRQEIGQLRGEISRLDQKIDEQAGQLRSEMNQLRQEIRQEMSQLNHRIDTVIQMLSELMRR